MNKFTMGLAAIVALSSVACKKNMDQAVNDRSLTAEPTYLGVDTLRGVIATDRTLSKDTLYRLDGKVFVAKGKTLTIPAGTWIKGIKKTTAVDASALIVLRGAKVRANGAATNPVVFTSNEAVPAPGDWGGVVLLGRALVNKSNPLIEGIDASLTLPVGSGLTLDSLRYGGTTTADNSGVINYARIEYAGASISANNELNGLTCGGVGSATVLTNIQVSYGRDDAFEFFGGSVNGFHLVALGADDDSYDTDFGYSGTISYSLSVLNPNKSAYSSDPNGIEADNDGSGSFDTPQSFPKFNHVTILGIRDTATATAKGFLNGARFRRRTNLTVTNSIFQGFPNGARFESNFTRDTASLNFTHNLVQGYRTSFLDVTSLPATNTTFLNGGYDSVKLVSPWDYTDFRPVSGTPAATSGNDATGYRGAFHPTQAQWTANWTRFDYVVNF
ncbi:hypothetical protein HNQ91_001236 [Filimonas zeae]|uniref:T9SS C-terminal target domain-containing protein n=1 Tax=Filimonas zeae TaxID=1737353 RepID=A0A917ISM7_9BACT|nr:hypothetical protein [Filimonas zeae]MDR6338214.1 hypothetical protein [Filimonas zeae]GGH62276.1 hypothetical protein GCM10011379_12100 [Filimonas zeae]